MSSADIVAKLSDELKIPLTKPEGAGKTTVHNLGGGKYLVQSGDQIQEFDANKKTQAISASGLLSGLGNGKITGYGGAYDGFKGLDIDGKI